MKKIQHLLVQLLWVTSIFILVFILYLNIHKNTTIYSALIPITTQTNSISILLSILMLAVFIVFINYFNQIQNIKLLWFIFTLLNILGLITKIYMAISVVNTPIADSYQVIDTANKLVVGDPSIFWPGSYLSIFQFQSSLVLIYSIWARFFFYNSVRYYILNAIIIQTSILLIALSWIKKYHLRIAIYTTLLLTLFLPNTWMTHFIYGDTLAFLALSLILAFDQFIKKTWLKLILIIFAIVLMSQTRTISGILIIAYSIHILLKKSVNTKHISVSIGLLLLLIIPSQIIQSTFDHFTEFYKGMSTLPANTFLRIGLNYSETSLVPGYYDKNVLYDFSNFLYDTKTMKEHNEKLINEQLVKLSNIDYALKFLKEKYTAVFTDPDFESLANYYPILLEEIDLFSFREEAILSGAGAVDVYAKTNLTRWVLNQHNRIIILEKAYWIALILMLFYTQLKNHKNSLVSLIILGVFLYFGLFEIKPRYVWLFVNVLIIYLPTKWSKLTQKDLKDAYLISKD